MNVSIGRCDAGEIDDIIRFIDEHWKSAHALTTCRPLLDWQHRDMDGRGYSFVVARRRRDSTVLGILGYVPTRRFDPALGGDNVVWLTIWKVRADSGVAGLGLLLLQYLTRTEPHLAIGALGLNPATIPIYKALGYRVGELRHYVRANDAFETFEIAKLRRSSVPLPAAERPLQPLRLTHDDEFAAFQWAPEDSPIPRKTPEYFRTRYARHPVYGYIVIALLDAGAPAGLLAVRPAEHAGRRALRLVDFLGADHVLARTGPLVQTLLLELGAEYADVYNTGIEQEVFECAGFRPVDPEGPEIVPDHFEPFERRNIRLWFSLKGPHEEVLFKGDADQDRPNLVLPPSP